MRKKYFIWILAVTSMFCFFPGCQKTTAQSGLQGAVSLPETFSAQTHIQYGGLALEGSFQRSISGSASLSITAPENLSGLRLTVSEGELEMTFEEMTFMVDTQVQTEKAVMEIMTCALNCLNGTTFRHPAGAGPFKMEIETVQGQMQAVLESSEEKALKPTNFIPSRISIKDIKFDASFMI